MKISTYIESWVRCSNIFSFLNTAVAFTEDHYIAIFFLYTGAALAFYLSAAHTSLGTGKRDIEGVSHMTTPATETPTMEESSSTITLAWPELEVLAEAETYPRSLDRVAVPAEVEELPEVEPPPQEIIDIVRESLEQVRNLIAEAQSSTNDADQNNVNNDVPKPILEPVMTGALDADTEIPRTSTELTVERVETASTSSTEACSNKDRKVHRFKPRSWLKQAKAHQKGKQETTKHLGETTMYVCAARTFHYCLLTLSQ